MPYHVAVQFLTFVRDLPPKIHFFCALAFGTGGVIVEKIMPNTLVGLANLFGLALALLGGWRAYRQQESTNKRKEMILDAQLKQALEPMARRQDVSEKAIKHVRRRQIEMQHSVKGLEEMREVFGLKATVEQPCLLLVEDDPATLKKYIQFFKLNLDDPCIIQAMSIADSLIQIKKLPAWIIADLKIVDGHFLEVVPKAKALNPDVKIVIITGLHDPNQIAAATAMGVEMIMKTPSKAQLDHLIKRLRKDFGVPAPSSDSIPVVGVSGIHPVIDPDRSILEDDLPQGTVPET